MPEKDIIKKALAEESLTREEIVTLLSVTDPKVCLLYTSIMSK